MNLEKLSDSELVHHQQRLHNSMNGKGYGISKSAQEISVEEEIKDRNDGKSVKEDS